MSNAKKAAPTLDEHAPRLVLRKARLLLDSPGRIDGFFTTEEDGPLTTNRISFLTTGFVGDKESFELTSVLSLVEREAAKRLRGDRASMVTVANSASGSPLRVRFEGSKGSSFTVRVVDVDSEFTEMLSSLITYLITLVR